MLAVSPFIEKRMLHRRLLVLALLSNEDLGPAPDTHTSDGEVELRTRQQLNDGIRVVDHEANCRHL